MALSLRAPHGHTPGFLTHSPAGQGLRKLSLLCQMVTYLKLETAGGSLVAEPSPATLAASLASACLDLPPHRLPVTPVSLQHGHLQPWPSMPRGVQIK